MDDPQDLAGGHPVEIVGHAGGIQPLVDLQAPRQRGVTAVQLLIEVVSEPADGLGQDDSGRDRVAEGRQRYAARAATDPGSDTTQCDGSPNAQAALPYLEGSAKALAGGPEIGGPVRHNVVQPATDEPERHCPQGDVIDDAGLSAPRLPTPVADHQRGDDAHDDAERVRADRHRAQMPDAL